jgi:hypothetical protein
MAGNRRFGTSFLGLGSGSGLAAWSENVQFELGIGLAFRCERSGAGLAGLFAGATVARPALRREILHWGARERSVLPGDLSCADGEGGKLPIFCDGRRGGGGGIPTLFTVPAGVFTRDAGVVRNVEYRFAGTAIDCGERARRWWSGGAGGSAGSGAAALAAIIFEASGGDADCCGAYAASALCEEVD